MYNFDSDPLPTFFPVHEGTLLQPWFSSSLLDQGLKLLGDERVSHFYGIRRTTGALIDQEAPVFIQFEKNTRLHQGFAAVYHHCTICGLKTRKKPCIHLAALAILSLGTKDTNGKIVPSPLQFEGSEWSKIAHFLYNWLGKANVSVHRHKLKEGTLLGVKPRKGEGKVRIFIPDTWSEMAEFLMRGKAGQKSKVKEDYGLDLLQNQMQFLAMTANERALAGAGSRSKGLQKEISVWTWLARMFCLLHHNALPELHRNTETRTFSLKLGKVQEVGSLLIELPREKTWELIRSVNFAGPEARIGTRAKECFQVFFNDDNQLEVHPCLKLADGRVLMREELNQDRFSNSYYLEGEGFVPTTRLPAEGTFTQPAEQNSAMPLLGFLHKEENRDQPFTIGPNEVPEFLSNNREPLVFPDNIVAKELFDLQLSELPDSLIINSYEKRDDWCYLSLHYGLGNTRIALADIATAREKQLSHLSGKTWLQLEDTPLSWFHELTSDRIDKEGDGRIRLTSRELLALTSIIGEFEICNSKTPAHQQLAALLDTSAWTDDSSLTNFPAHLRKYQRHGLAWLRRLFLLGIGGLLADDMGLGKTHQGLALVQAAMREGEKLPILVVAPSSVILNWGEKIDAFYPDLNYEIYYGPGRSLAENHGLKIILTTYGIVRQDLDQLQACAFGIILLDEIQHAKNSNTATHKAVAALNGRVKIGLTGTPVENSLQDLRSLYDICIPGLLGTQRSFQQLYATPIENGNTETQARLARLTHPFILRRSRGQVLKELPEIIEDNRICVLSDDQVGLYRDVIDDHERELEELEQGSAEMGYMNILATITKLKQICCHPCLVSDCQEGRKYESGKWNLFTELAEELLSANIKFVVFSQYTSMLAIIEEYLQEKEIGFASLKGDMPATTRQKMINEFNTSEGCQVFCASLLAGGVGIDLTSAQAVIHYDRWWNPAREEQATARVHRMGQKSVVQVFRLITQGTLEEKIHQLIDKKRKLAEALIQDDDAEIIKSLDRKDLAELLRPSLREPSRVGRKSREEEPALRQVPLV